MAELPYEITDIKAHIPLILDLHELNYNAWRELFKTHCIAFGVIHHIDGSSENRPADREWSKLDSIVKLWIYGTISKSLLTMILKKKNVSARDVWLRLETLFRDNIHARAIQIDHELRHVTIGDRSVVDYCKHVKYLADLLDSIDNPVSEKNLVTFMINGLSNKYEHIATIIRHRNPLPSFLQACSMLILEEQCLRRLDGRRQQPANGPTANNKRRGATFPMMADSASVSPPWQW